MQDRPEWQKWSECRGVSPALFFPGDGYDERTAKRLCEACPVRNECREYAIAEKELVGVWGGMNAADRRRLVRSRRRLGKLAVA